MLHGIENEICRHRLEFKVDVGIQLGVDRHQIVLAIHLQAMASVKEQGKIRTFEFGDELPHGFSHIPK